MNTTLERSAPSTLRRILPGLLVALVAGACGAGPRALRAPLESDPVPRCLATFVQPRFDVREQSANDEAAAEAIHSTLAGNRALLEGNCLDAATHFENARNLSPQHPDLQDLARFRLLCRPCEQPSVSASLASR